MKNPDRSHGRSSRETQKKSETSRSKLIGILGLVGLLLIILFLMRPKQATENSIEREQAAKDSLHKSVTKAFIPKEVHLSETKKDELSYTEFKTSVMDPQYVFDVTEAGGTKRYLVGTKWDREFVPDSDAMVGRDLWVTDESGRERLVHESVTRACFSPDGSKLAYITTENVLHAETFEGESLGSVPRAYDPSWRQDGSQILFSQVPEGMEVWPAEQLGLSIWDYKENKIQTVTSGNIDDIHGHFGPDGDWILFVSAGRSGWASFYVIPTAGGEPVPLTNRDMGIPVPYNRMMWSKDGRWFVYDAKDGDVQETWALEINGQGQLLQAKKLADALDPQVLTGGTVVSTRRVGDSIAPIVSQLPNNPGTQITN